LSFCFFQLLQAAARVTPLIDTDHILGFGCANFEPYSGFFAKRTNGWGQKGQILLSKFEFLHANGSFSSLLFP
jgi:hypothetical protein